MMLSVPLALLALLQAVAGQSALQEGLDFLEKNKQREEVIVTASGLQYEILKSGPKENPHPNASSPCLCHYRGTLIDGTEFDSSYSRGTPATFSPSQVVAGWTEALQLMRAGDHWKLYVPNELAYGSRGAGGKIPGNAALVFELEILEVKESGGGLDAILAALQQNPMVPMLLLGALWMAWQNKDAIMAMFGAGGGGKTEIKIEDAKQAKENTRVFFDVSIGDEDQDRVEMVLFAGSYPKTAENFRALCTGEKGKGKSGKDLTFKGSKFHRIIPGFMCQGGDFTRGDGTGGESIYGAKFDDEWENGYIAHNRPYLLSMANAGPNTNGSQFFLTVAVTSHLDGKHVVFGEVVEGVATVKKMEAVGSGGGSCRKPVVIKDCGELKTKDT